MGSRKALTAARRARPRLALEREQIIAAALVDVALVPRPRFLDVRSGTVTWRSPLRISVELEWREVVATFARDLETSIGWTVEVVNERVKGQREG